MKIARFTEGGRTRLGIVAIDTDEIIDVGSADPSLPTDVGRAAGRRRTGRRRRASPRSASRLPLSARASWKHRSPSPRRSWPSA